MLSVRFSPCSEVWHVSDGNFIGIQACMDEYEVIKCINYIRASVKAGRDPRSELAGAVSTPEKPWQDDKYLIPVLPDDAMLFHEFSLGVGGLPSSSARHAPPVSVTHMKEATPQAQCSTCLTSLKEGTWRWKSPRANISLNISKGNESMFLARNMACRKAKRFPSKIKV